jgi:hypothetical protein
LVVPFPEDLLFAFGVVLACVGVFVLVLVLAAAVVVLPFFFGVVGLGLGFFVGRTSIMDYLVIVIGRSGMGMMGGEVVRMVPVVIKVVVRDPRSVVVVVVMKRVFVRTDVVVSMDEVKESRLKHGESVKAVGSVWREARGGRTMIEV